MVCWAKFNDLAENSMQVHEMKYYVKMQQQAVEVLL